MNLLRCEGLQLKAGSKVLITALDWKVARGELWCVLGINGVGKSTLLLTLAGLLQPARGSVRLDGGLLAHWSLERLARIRGVMAQQQADAFSATVLDAVLIGRTPHRLSGGGRLAGHWDSQADVHAARSALDAVDMAAFEASDVLRLSGGERQRVALATLLAQAPDLMLLDEPTSHQDVAHQLMIMRLMRSRSMQHAVVVTTHDINLATRFATHVLLLSPDRFDAGPAAEVLTAANLGHAFGCGFDVVGDAAQQCFVARLPV